MRNRPPGFAGVAISFMAFLVRHKFPLTIPVQSVTYKYIVYSTYMHTTKKGWGKKGISASAERPLPSLFSAEHVYLCMYICPMQAKVLRLRHKTQYAMCGTFLPESPQPFVAPSVEIFIRRRCLHHILGYSVMYLIATNSMSAKADGGRLSH